MVLQEKGEEPAVFSHDVYEDMTRSEWDWPQYAKWNPEDKPDGNDTLPEYYRIEGPNGPVTRMGANSTRSFAFTMFDLAIIATDEGFEWVRNEEQTPFTELEDSNHEASN